MVWVRISITLGFWLASTVLHRVASDFVETEFQMPWGGFTAVDYTAVGMVLAAASLVLLVAWQARRRSSVNGSRAGATGAARSPTLQLWTLWLAAVGVCYWTLTTVNVEFIHYPQYGLVGGLLAWTLDPRRDRRLVLEVMLISVVLSAVDESLQYFYLMEEQEYFDFNDLALNQVGVFAGLLAYYGFPDRQRPAAVGPRRLLVALLLGYAVLAVVAAALVTSGGIVIEPDEQLTQDEILRFVGGLHIALQWEAGIYGAAHPSRMGGTYFVIGPLGWLATLVATLLVAWLVELRLRAPGRR